MKGGFLCLLWFFSFSLSAQINVTTSNQTDLSVERLVEDVFIGNGIRITNINVIGSNQSIGLFDNAINDINLNRGLVLSTGKVSSIDMANTSETTGSTADVDFAPSDPDLQALTSNELKEVTGVEIEFVPQSNSLEFRYVFASEEYPEFNCSKFNDIFAFFISGPNPNGPDYQLQNIALVPDPSDPSGNTFTDFPVWTNSVNNGAVGVNNAADLCDKENESLAFSEYYNDNSGSLNFTFDGFLDVFKAKAEVVPCAVYTIKLIIGDSNDFDFDSAVFLEGKSLSTTNYKIYSDVGLDNKLTEGCSAGSLIIEFDNPVSSSTSIPIEIVQDIRDGSADGSDYIIERNEFVLQSGESRATIDITAIDDGIVEGDERLRIISTNELCAIDTIELVIQDDLVSTFSTTFNDQSICEPTSLTELGLPASTERKGIYRSTFDIRSFGSAQNLSISIDLSIDIEGVYPISQIMQDLCIEGLTHDDLSELRILLRTPDGRFYSIVNPGDLSGSSFGQDLCLSGIMNLDDIFFQDKIEVGGIWTLIIEDVEINNQRGSLDRAYISLINPDFVSVDITTSDNNLVDGSYIVDSDVTFYIESINAEDCTYRDTVRIDYSDDLIPPTDLSCTEIARDQLQFTWTIIDSSVNYEVQIDNDGAWVSVGKDNFYVISDLLSGETVNLSVRSTASSCSSITESLLCGTSQCVEPDLSIVRRINNSSACEPNGSVELSSTTTKGPYAYYIDSIRYDDAIIPGLDQGSYTVTIVDGYGCENSVDFVIDGVPELKVELEIENAYCGLQGFADLFVTGGNPPYQYSWSTGSTESSAFGLDSGVHSFTITDQSGCVYSEEFTVETSEGIEIEILDLVDINCSGDGTGSVNLNIVGGTAPYDLIIKDENDGVLPESSLDGLTAGTYSIEVIDVLACSNIAAVVIAEPEKLVVEASSTNASCNYVSDGNIQLTITGGVQPYDINWSDGERSESIADLAAGEYVYVVTDSNNCRVMDTVVISETTTVGIEVTSQNLGCANQNDGSIELTAQSGIIENVQWSGGLTGVFIDDLAAGEYCATISFVEGCVIDTCITLTQPDPISARITVQDNQCFGQNDASIGMLISDGQGPYEVLFNNIVYPSDGQLDIDSLGAGDYQLEITDARGCMNAVDVSLSAAETVIIQHESVDNSCKGEKKGSISLAISGIEDDYQVTWVGPDQVNRSGSVINNLISGNYEALINTASGCSFNYNATITEPSEALSGTALPIDVICHGEASGTININTTGATGNVTYILNEEIETSNPVINNLTAGTYDIAIVDASDCRFEIMDVIVQEPLPFSILLDTDTFTYEMQDVDIALSVEGAQGDYDLFWVSDPADMIPCAGCDSFTFEAIESSIIISVEAMDDAGCVAYDERKIFVKRANHIEVPTAFTPNEDGQNDKLFVYGTSGAVITEFHVYDRNGVNLYTQGSSETNAESIGWNGTYKGEMMPAGIYIWTASAVFPDGRLDTFTGTTTLLR